MNATGGMPVIQPGLSAHQNAGKKDHPKSFQPKLLERLSFCIDET